MRFILRFFGLEISNSIGPDENLAGRDLRRRDFSGATLRGRDLSNTNLAGVNLAGRDLSGANLSGADLRGADLTPDVPRGFQRYRQPANLTGANLTGANLTGANLTGANLTGANLTNARGVPVRQEGINLNFAKQLSRNPAGMTLREFLTRGAAMEKTQENQNVLHRWRNVGLSGAIMPDGTIHD